MLLAYLAEHSLVHWYIINQKKIWPKFLLAGPNFCHPWKILSLRADK